MDQLKYVIGVIGMIALVWVFATFASKMTEDVQVIRPSPGISCAIVSRTFNTSIDCWKEAK